MYILFLVLYAEGLAEIDKAKDVIKELTEWKAKHKATLNQVKALEDELLCQQNDAAYYELKLNRADEWAHEMGYIINWDKALADWISKEGYYEE